MFHSLFLFIKRNFFLSIGPAVLATFAVAAIKLLNP